MLFRFWVFPDCTFLDISIYIVVLMTLLPHPKGLYGTSTRKEIFNNHLFLSPFPIATLIVTPRV